MANPTIYWVDWFRVALLEWVLVVLLGLVRFGVKPEARLGVPSILRWTRRAPGSTKGEGGWVIKFIKNLICSCVLMIVKQVL